MLRMRSFLTLVGTLTVAALLSACGSASTTTTNGGAPGATATVASTTAPAATCSSLIASPLGTPLSNIVFPPNTIIATPSVTAMGEASFVVQHFAGCAPHSDPNLTISGAKGDFAFTSALFFAGWATSGKFPYNGQLEQPCTGTACFVFNAVPSQPKYLSFDGVTDHGGGVISFLFTTALPPPAPTCDAGFSAAFAYTYPATTAPYSAIPLPPLTRTEPNNAAGHIGFSLCSPGDSAAITTFINAQLASQGWTATDASGDFTNSGHTLQVVIFGSDAAHDTTNWGMDFPNSAG